MEFSKKILIVDDEKNVCRSLSIGLRREGYEVDIASDGPQAISKMKHNYYDFLLTDIRMPHMSGLELAKIVTKIHPEITMIFMSAYDMVNLCDDDEDLSKYPKLSKPFNISELIFLLKNRAGYERLQVRANMALA